MFSGNGPRTDRLPLSFQKPSAPSAPSAPAAEKAPSDGIDASKADLGAISQDILKGGSIAPKLENATAKYGIFYIPSPSAYARGGHFNFDRLNIYKKHTLADM